MEYILILKRPIVRLDLIDDSGQRNQIPVALRIMDKELISMWGNYVQPIIDKNYVLAKNKVTPKEKIRADVNWNWRRIFMLAQVCEVVKINPKSLAVCIVVYLNGKEFPLGMLTVVPGFTCNAFGETKPRSFTWYLSDAPEEFYREILNCPPVRGIAHALLDCSIQAGIELGNDGSMLLHADPQGGERLRNFYLEKCGMTPLPEGNPRISIARGRSNNEYFHFDDVQAKKYSAIFDHRR